MSIPHKPSTVTDVAAQATRQQILNRIRADKGLPTLGVAIAKVVEIASSGEDSVADLAHFILSDVALTQQILRLSNTIAYRTSGSVSVTTISRAIFLLGFDTIKANALAALLVDGFKNQRQAQAVRRELVQALCASVAAREISRKTSPHNSEEAAVAALFKNIGRILVASFDHLLYEKIQSEIRTRCPPATFISSLAASDICSQHLGCSFERFGDAVLQDWKIPDTIIHALQALPAGDQKKSSNHNEWLKQVACLSEAIGEMFINEQTDTDAKNIDYACQPLIKRFGSALDLNTDQLKEILKRVQAETRQLAITLDVSLSPLPSISSSHAAAADENDFCKEFMLPALEQQQVQASTRFASGKPSNARDLLLLGVQDATQMLSAQQLRLNELILLVLETLYTALGFRFATACLRDVQHAKYLARITVGEKHSERQNAFQFAATNGSSVFELAMNKNVDLMIADARNEKIQTMLPAWHKQLLPDTQSFIVLPLVIEQKPLGFFYADRIFTAEEGVSPEETALIKTLKGQLLSAMIKR